MARLSNNGNGSASDMQRVGYPPERHAKSTAMEFELEDEGRSDDEVDDGRNSGPSQRGCIWTRADGQTGRDGVRRSSSGLDGLSEPLLGTARPSSVLEAGQALDDDLLYSLGRAAKSDIPAAIANVGRADPTGAAVALG